MRIFTELEPSTYEQIEEHVREGKYESVDQFLRVAAQNQLAIERSQGNGSESPSRNGQSPESQFHWSFSPPQDILTISPSQANRDQILLFSQYYRFFPLKLALWKVAETTSTTVGPNPIGQVRDYVIREIEPIRDRIVDWEKENDIKKRDRKSTGFPKNDVKNAERSKERYLDHYVGKIQRQKGEPAGFGYDLGFVSFAQSDGIWEISLSQDGADFVQLSNPILEGGPDNPTLSDEERMFLTTAIRSNLDEEYRFMKFIYDVLSDGQGSYTDYMDQFRDFLEESPGASDDPSDNSVRSQVGGAISRMVELGILESMPRRGWYSPKQHPDEFSVDAARH